MPELNFLQLVEGICGAIAQVSMRWVGVGVWSQSRRKWFMDEKVIDILAEALQMSSPGTRRAWLEGAYAGDKDLRRSSGHPACRRAVRLARWNGRSSGSKLRLPVRPAGCRPPRQARCAPLLGAGARLCPPRGGHFRVLTEWRRRAQPSHTTRFGFRTRIVQPMDGSLYNIRSAR
jgi:hypothetical protein